MRIDRNGYIHASMHDFKTNLARYVRALEEGQARAVVLCRHKDPVGLFITSKRGWSDKGG